YNVRMGDPETESVLPRIESDLVDLLEGVANGDLANRSYTVSPKTAVTVMLVSGGYPGDYESGKVISNIENVKESIVFHSGTKEGNGEVLTAGARVIAVTTMQDDLLSAL